MERGEGHNVGNVLGSRRGVDNIVVDDRVMLLLRVFPSLLRHPQQLQPERKLTMTMAVKNANRWRAAA